MDRTAKGLDTQTGQGRKPSPGSVVLVSGDCLELMKAMPDDSVDLVFCSPPYEAARTYGIGFNLRGQEWVDWSFARFMECLRVSRGLVAWVVEGRTKNFRYSATPALLMADLHRAGVKLRHPGAYRRIGIPGSGGPDGFRNDWEFIITAARGKLPWSDNTACGHAPKYAPGGAMSNRTEDGRRKNARDREGRRHTKRRASGEMEVQQYKPPKMANPGNVAERAYTPVEVFDLMETLGLPVEHGDVTDCKVGGGLMGNDLAHENEAPFPESLAEKYIRSFCPPGGTVLDIFSGSGTTVDVAQRWGRNGIGFDVRPSQIDLARQRIKGEWKQVGSSWQMTQA